MANLTKIFTGMEKGPEAIDDNFNSVESDISASKSSNPVTLSVNSGVTISSDSPLRVWRIGNTVFLGGATQTGPATGSSLTTIPSGYRPDEKVGFMAGVQVNPIVGAFFQVQTDGTVSCVYNTNRNALTFYDGITWQTNDDFPA